MGHLLTNECVKYLQTTNNKILIISVVCHLGLHEYMCNYINVLPQVTGSLFSFSMQKI